MDEAAVHGGAAGVGVGAAQGERARALFGEGAGATEDGGDADCMAVAVDERAAGIDRHIAGLVARDKVTLVDPGLEDATVESHGAGATAFRDLVGRKGAAIAAGARESERSARSGVESRGEGAGIGPSATADGRGALTPCHVSDRGVAVGEGAAGDE